jgi:hypothetical protein
MVESSGTPGNRVVAVFTRFRCWQMGIGFANRVHIVMTGGAPGGDARMIETHILPGLIGGMAVVTSRIGYDMIRGFAGGGRAIMATGAGPDHDGMVEQHLSPVGG